jgi:urease accessory protein UreF
MSEATESSPTKTEPAQTSTWTKSVLTWLRGLLSRAWIWVALAVTALVGLAAARSSGKRDGKTHAALDNLAHTLKEIDAAKARLAELGKKKLELAGHIAAEAAKRTNTLNEDLTPEEVTRRLKDKGFIKR